MQIEADQSLCPACGAEGLEGTSNNGRGHKFGLGLVFDCPPGLLFPPTASVGIRRQLHRLHAAASRSSVTRRRML